MSAEMEIINFLSDLHLDDYFLEFEEYKGEDLTDEEKKGIEIFFSAVLYDQETVTEALRDNKMDFLKDILLTALEEENQDIEKEEILKVNNEAMNSFIELIQKIGADQIRMALDLLTDEDIEGLEDEE